MLRFRRYRIFLIGAFVLTLLLYHVSRNSQWEPNELPTNEKTRPHADSPGDSTVHSPERAAQPDRVESNAKKEQAIKIPQLKTEDNLKGGYGLPAQTPTPSKPDVAPNKPAAHGSTTTTKAADPLTIPDGKPGAVHDVYGNAEDSDDESIHIGKRPGAYQGVPLSTTSTVIHWQKQAEWYPIEEQSLIALPTGKPKSIPTIQHRFKSESPEAAEVRKGRLQKVKDEARRAWLGYKKYAWTHDEVMPVSLKARDPFCGWAATLVDALDTLWIMGMKDEFEDAVQAVRDIDFTTTPYRTDIPVFETVIRYLGGLLAAYDVSGGRKGNYQILLDKAIELAEILMGVFDTPNRMPILYYNWKPAFRGQHLRASTSASIAELGSMSMEFTRLAQLTGEDKYYDAIARITNALEEWQSRGTTLPGIFPETVDASGCNRSAAALASLSSSSDLAQDQAKEAVDLEDDPQGYIPKTSAQKFRPNADVMASSGPVESGDRSKRSQAGGSEEAQDLLPTEHRSRAPLKASTDTRAAGKAVNNATKKKQPLTAQGRPVDWDCVPQGLDTGGYGWESYSMGGSQDSTYEYFPKTWLLLGGLEPKYQTMHERVSRAVKKYLLYRPMVEGERDILFSGKAKTTGGSDKNINMDYEVTHLTCFLGGMFGLGGKIFENEEDVEIGKRLADGCVWAYESMPTGVMAEWSTVIPCAKLDKCHWNQTLWYEHIDASAEWRRSQMEKYLNEKEQWDVQIQDLKERKALGEQRLSEKSTASLPADVDSSSRDSEDRVKLLEDKLDLNAGATHGSRSGGVADQIPLAESDWPKAPVKPQSHEEYVQSRLKSEYLPPGVTSLNDKRYILRPEAIESVWYMYRITGDPSWQEKGWRMFEAIIKATRTEGGHSAVADVSLSGKKLRLMDNMESFWIAETLKYFYLLFETPDVISLDEWVLNTEAHPFRRPT